MKTSMMLVCAFAGALLFQSCSNEPDLTNQELAGTWNVDRYRDKVQDTEENYDPGEFTYTFEVSGELFIAGPLIDPSAFSYALDGNMITITTGQATTAYTIETFTDDEFEIESSSENIRMRR